MIKNFLLISILALLSQNTYCQYNSSNSLSDSAMYNERLVELLGKIDLKLFSSSEELKEAIYVNLPISHEEGVAIRLWEPENIDKQQVTSILILIGIGADKNLITPLSEHARVKWTNLESNVTSEVMLFEKSQYKIPVADMPQPPENPVEAIHSYSVEIINIRKKLKLEWVPSKYTIQVVIGGIVSNKVDFEIKRPSP